MMPGERNLQALSVRPLNRHYEWRCRECNGRSRGHGGDENMEAAISHTLETGHGTICRSIFPYHFSVVQSNGEVPHA